MGLGSGDRSIGSVSLPFWVGVNWGAAHMFERMMEGFFYSRWGSDAGQLCILNGEDGDGESQTGCREEWENFLKLRKREILQMRS